jgi:hypothetical protein
VRCASAARLSEAAGYGRGYRILLACLIRYDVLACCMRSMCVDAMCCVDRMVIHRHCVVAFSCCVEGARPPTLGNEVSSTMDLAMGPTFCGMYSLYSLPPVFFHAFFLLPDHRRFNHDTLCVSSLHGFLFLFVFLIHASAAFFFPISFDPAQSKAGPPSYPTSPQSNSCHSISNCS